MDEDDVDGCGGVVVDAGYFETLYLVEGGFGSLISKCQLGCVAAEISSG